MALEVYSVVKIEKSYGKFLNSKNAKKYFDNLKNSCDENFAIVKTINGVSEVLVTSKGI